MMGNAILLNPNYGLEDDKQVTIPMRRPVSHQNAPPSKCVAIRVFACWAQAMTALSGRSVVFVHSCAVHAVSVRERVHASLESFVCVILRVSEWYESLCWSVHSYVDYCRKQQRLETAERRFTHLVRQRIQERRQREQLEHRQSLPR